MLACTVRTLCVLWFLVKTSFRDSALCPWRNWSSAYSGHWGIQTYQRYVYCKDFVCSVVLGKDLVPRLGLVSMEELKFRVLRALRDTNLPKVCVQLQLYKCHLQSIATWKSFLSLPGGRTFKQMAIQFLKYLSYQNVACSCKINSDTLDLFAQYPSFWFSHYYINVLGTSIQLCICTH